MNAKSKHSSPLNQTGTFRLILPVLLAVALLLAMAFAFQPAGNALAEDGVSVLVGQSKGDTLARPAPIAQSDSRFAASSMPTYAFGAATGFAQQNFDGSALGTGATTSGANPLAVYLSASSPIGTEFGFDTYYLEIEVAEVISVSGSYVADWDNAMEFRSAAMSKPNGTARDYPWTLIWGLEEGKFYQWRSCERSEENLATTTGCGSAPTASLFAGQPLNSFNTVGALGSGTIYYITYTLDAYALDGYCTLREAVQASITNAAVNECPAGSPDPLLDVIVLLDDTYFLTNDTIDPDNTPDLDIWDADPGQSGPLMIYGAGREVTTIEVNYPDGARAFEIHPSAFPVTFTRFTITGGNLVSAAANATTLQVCTTDQAEFDGGAVYNAADLNLIDVGFDENNANDGGAIFNSGVITGTEVYFTGNDASMLPLVHNCGGNGGAIYNTGTVTLDNATFFGNTADADSILLAGIGGGAIYNSEFGVVEITASHFEENFVKKAGAGILNWGVLTVTNTTFFNNTAENFGGGVYNVGNAYIEGSTLYGNQTQTTGDGGAGVYAGQIGIVGSVTEIFNSTVSGNTTVGNGAGVGLVGTNSVMTLTHVTIAYNTATDGSSRGGGIYVGGAICGALLYPSLNLYATLVVYNTAFAGTNNFAGGGNDLGFNLTNNAAGLCPGSSLLAGITVNASTSLIKPLADNGGLTKTHMPNHAAVIDKVLGCPAGYDQRDFPFYRPFDVPDVTGNGCDIGSVEFFGYLASGGPVWNDTQDIAYPTIQLALDAAAPGDHIYVMSWPFPGIPQPFYERPLGGGVQQIGYINQNQSLFGGWDGTLIANNANQNSAPTELFGYDMGRHFFITGTVNVLIDKFDLYNGSAFDGGANGYGGSIYINGADVTLNDLSVYSSTAAYGGAVYVASSLDVTGDSNFAENTALANGGAIYATNASDVTLTGADFFTNTAVSTTAGDRSAEGGAVFVENGTLTVNGGTYRYNSAGHNGGAIYVYSTTATTAISGATFTMNMAGTEGRGDGGGVFNAYFADLALTGASFYSNTASYDGGGVYSDRSMRVATSTFQGNTANEEGGGIKAEGAGQAILDDIWRTFVNMTVSGSTFTGNLAGLSVADSDGDGGGIYVSHDIRVNLSNFYDNLAHLTTGEGGAINVLAGLNVSITDSYFEGNEAGDEGGAVNVDNSAPNDTGNEELHGPDTTDVALATILNSDFYSNTAHNDDGGAVNVNIGRVVITDSDFYYNRAPHTTFGEGGAVNVDDGEVEVTRGTFESNLAGVDGGGVHANNTGGEADATNVYFGDVILHNATFLNNVAQTGNGGGVWAANNIYDNNTNSVLTANLAELSGGGMYAVNNILLNGTKFLNNEADQFYGGGLYAGGYLIAESAVFTTNVAGTHGGGAYVVGNATITTTLFLTNSADLNEGTGGILANTSGLQNGNGGGLWTGASLFSLSSLFQGNQANNDGGGAWVTTQAIVTLTTFFTNTADMDAITDNDGNGGGLYIVGSASPFASLISYGTLWDTNEADNDGGGAYVQLGDADLRMSNGTQTIFRGNVADAAGDDDGNGGGLYVADGDLYDINTNSLFEYNYAHANGGGAYVYGNAYLNQTTFQYNIADDVDGGGLFAVENLYALSAIFLSNEAGDDGGGAYIQGIAVITSTQFLSNTADVDESTTPPASADNGTQNGDGGGLYVEGIASPGVSLKATGSLFLLNESDQDGGGAYVFQGDVRLDETIFSLNIADGDDDDMGEGGGLKVADGNLYDDTSNSQFLDNYASQNGGGAYVSGFAILNGTQVLRNVAAFGDGGGLWIGEYLVGTDILVKDNYAQDHGGGAYVATGTTTLYTSIFDTNLADFGDGGGLWTYGMLTAHDTTFIDNVAGDDGGGAFVAQAGALLFGGDFTTNIALGEMITHSQGLNYSDVYTGSGDGGGLWTFNNVNATDTVWDRNDAADDGGGMFIYDGNGYLTATLFVDNVARGRIPVYTTTHIGILADIDGDGGGAYISGTVPTNGNLYAWDARWITNAAEDNGGGAWVKYDTFTWNNTFYRNDAGTGIVQGLADYGPDDDPTVFYGDGGGLWTGHDLTDIGSTWEANVADDDGGGAYVAGYPTAYLTNSTFQFNSAIGGDGGGLWAIAAYATNSLWLENLAGDDGGGAYLELMGTITSSTFTRNYAAGGETVTVITATIVIEEAYGAYGGGLYVGETLWMTDTLVNENIARNLDDDLARGGGIYVGNPDPAVLTYDSQTEIYSSTVILNLAAGNNAAGGGIAAEKGTVWIEDTDILTNTAENVLFPFAILLPMGPAYGGGVWAYWTTATITNSLVVANLAHGGSAGGMGGGVYGAGYTDIYRTMFLRNTAGGSELGGGFGGGVFLTNSPFGGQAYLENNVFAGNLADNLAKAGHAIVLDAMDDNGVVIHNTIAGTQPLVPPCGCELDLPLDGAAIYLPTSGYNYAFTGTTNVLVTETIITSYTIGILAESTGTGFLGIMEEDWNLYYDVQIPVIGLVIGSNTIVGVDPNFANANADDFHLLPPSGAIDAGVAFSIPNDFDFVPRPQGPRVDIGAYETPQVFCNFPATGCHYHVYMNGDLLTIDVYTSTQPGAPWIYVDLAETITYDTSAMYIYTLLLHGTDQVDSVKPDNSNGNPFPDGAGLWFFGYDGLDYTVMTGTVPVSNVAYSYNEAIAGSITGTVTTDNGILRFFGVAGETFDYLTKDNLTFNYNVDMNNIHILDARPGAHAGFGATGYGTLGDDFSRVKPTAPVNSAELFFTNPLLTVTFNGSPAADMFMNHGMDGYLGEYYYNGLGGDDLLWQYFADYEANPTLGHIFGSGSRFDGGDQDTDDGDLIQLSHGTFLTGSVTHLFTDASNGTITVNALGTTRDLNYTGLEPIEDVLEVANRVFYFNTFADDVVFMQAEGDLTIGGDTFTDINSISTDPATSERVDFAMATQTVDVFTAEGNDFVTVTDLNGNVDEWAFDVVTVTIYTGAGNDVVDATEITFGIVVDGGDGDDYLETGSGNDVLYDGDGDDLLEGRAGNDWYALTLGGDVTLIDTSGKDTLDFLFEGNAPDGLTIDMDSDAVQIVNTAGDTLHLIGQFENLIATDGDDTAYIKVLGDVDRYAHGGDEVMTDTLWIDAGGMPVIDFDHTPGSIMGTYDLEVGYGAGLLVPYDGYIITLNADGVTTDTLYFYEWEQVWIFNTTADLWVSKAGPATVIAGTQIEYTVMITNAVKPWPIYPPAATAYHAILNDNPEQPGAFIPDGISPIGSWISRPDNPAYALCSEGWTCAFGDLLYGETVTIILRAYIDPSLPAGYVLTNTVAAFALNTHVYEQSGLNPTITYPDMAMVTTTVETEVNLYLEKESLVDWIVSGGDPVQFVITVHNDGPSDAYNVVVTDSLHTGFFWNSELEPGNQWITCVADECTILWLPAGASVELYANLGAYQWLEDTTDTLNTNPAIRGTLYDANTACITDVDATYTDAGDDWCDTEELEVFNEADMGLVKTASPTSVAGEQIVYNVYVYNNGPSDNFGYSFIDILPPDIASVDGWSGPGTCNVIGTVSITCVEPAGLAAGDMHTYVFTVTTESYVLPGTSLENNVSFNGLATFDPISLNNQANADTSIVAVADLQISKSAPASVVAGWDGGYQFTIVVTNDGPSEAYGVKLVDSLPESVSLIGDPFFSVVRSSAPTHTDPQAQCSRDGVCLLGDMAVGEMITVTLDFMVDSSVVSGTTLTNFADAFVDTADSMDPDGATASVDFYVTAEASLFIEKEDLGTSMVAGGDGILYVITVRNDGPSDALAVQVTDIVEPGFVLDGDLEPGDQYMTCAANVCTFDLPAGMSVEIYAPIYAEAWVDDVSGDLALGTDYTTNEACVEITGDVLDLTPVACDDEDTTVFNIADLNVTKFATPTTTAGRYITYTIGLENTGPSDARDYVITDWLPEGVTYVSSHNVTATNLPPVPAGVYDPVDHTVVFTGSYLSAWDWHWYQIVVLVDPDIWPGTSLENLVDAFANDFDPNWLNNVATADTSVLAESNLVLNKTAPATVIAGETMEYVVTVNNEGPSDAYDVTILDDLDETRVTLLSANWDGTEFYCSSATCEYPGQLAVGDTVTMVLTVLVHADVEAGEMIYNTATVDTDSIYDVSLGDNSMTVSTLVETEVSLTIEKDDLVDTIVAGGDAILYVIRVYNEGPSDARDVVFEDLPVAGFSLASDLTPGGEMPMTCVADTCTIPQLPAGGMVEVYVSIAAAANVVPGLQDANEACLVSADATYVTLGDCAMEQTIVHTEADLAIGKTAPATVIAGEYMTYTMVVYNSGPSDASDVVVVDTLPVGVTFDGYTSTECTWIPATFYSFDCGTVAAGDTATIYIRVMVDADLEPGTGLQNMASVSSSTADTTLDNNTAYANTNVIGLADLEITKTGPDTVVAGERITYTITATNNGPSDAQAVDIKDDLPEWISLVSATVSGDFYESPMLCGGTVCQIGDFEAGATVVVTVVGLVDPSTPEGTILTNHAAIFSATDDPDASDNHDMWDTEVETVADLSIIKDSLFVTASQSSMVLFAIHVTNYGPSDAQNVVMIDQLPAGLKYVAISPSTGCNFSNAGQTVTCVLPMLAAGATQSYMLTALVGQTVVDGTVLTNEVSVSSDTYDPDLGNNEDSDYVMVWVLFREVDLSVTKEVVEDMPDGMPLRSIATTGVAAGQEVMYKLTVTNHGPTVATSVELIENLPAGLTILSISITAPDSQAFCEITSGACHLGKLHVGQQAVIMLLAKVGEDVADGTVLVNSVSVYANEPDLKPGNNMDEASVTVYADADLSITKADNPDFVLVEGKLVYTLTVMNHGPTAAVNVQVVDTLPEEVTYLHLSSDYRCIEAHTYEDEPTGVLTCDLGEMAPGQVEYIRIEVLVDEVLPHLTILENTACVASDRPDLDLTNNCATEETTVHSYADLSVTKVSDVQETLTGMPIRYDIEIRNAGPHTAAFVTLEDTLPGEQKFYGYATTQGTCMVDGQDITCDLGHLKPFTAANGFPTIKITFWVWAGIEGIWENVAVVSSLSYDEDLSDNESGATVIVYDELLVYEFCLDDGNPNNESTGAWTSTRTGNTITKIIRTPNDNKSFMGEFGRARQDEDAERAVLTLDNLFPHKRVRVEMFLGLFRSFDGNLTFDPWEKEEANRIVIIGPDVFELKDLTGGADDAVFRTTFSNFTSGLPSGYQHTQAYPDQYAGPTAPQMLAVLAAVDYGRSVESAMNAPLTGAEDINEYGFSWRHVPAMDSGYLIGSRANYDLDSELYPMIIFDHTDSELALDFGFPELQSVIRAEEDPNSDKDYFDESWGLNCVRVWVQGTSLKYKVMLPLIIR